MQKDKIISYIYTSCILPSSAALISNSFMAIRPGKLKLNNKIIKKLLNNLLKIFSLGAMLKFSQYMSEGAGAYTIFNLDPWYNSSLCFKNYV